MAETPRPLRAARRSAPSPSAPTGRLARTRTDPAFAATTAPPTPPGYRASGRASRPAGSDHSAASSSSPSAREDTNSSEPSGRNAGDDSPFADQVSRTASRRPAGSTSHREATYFALFASGWSTAATRREPSGLSARPVTRGSAATAARSANAVGFSGTRRLYGHPGSPPGEGRRRPSAARRPDQAVGHRQQRERDQRRDDEHDRAAHAEGGPAAA